MMNRGYIAARSFVQQSTRSFKTHNKEYAAGFEHLWRDKFTWLGTVPNFWVLLGLGNIAGFGLSLFMYKKTYAEQFAHEGHGVFFKPFKSWLASDKLINVAWTSPSLILGGYYMQRKVGSFTLFKYFLLASIAVYMSQTCFGPGSPTKDLNLRSYMPIRWDCIADDNNSQFGADGMAAAILYFALASYGMYVPLAACAVVDACYYGPQILGAPSAAVVAALTML